MLCSICQTKLGSPLYEAHSNKALTSLCELRTGKVKVWLCSNCGHLSGESMSNSHDYYAKDYRILLDHHDEDQIYEVKDGEIVFRTDHQINTLLGRLDLPQGARLLDYGCAKASMPRRLLNRRPDLYVHLFDVSEMYLGYWQKFLSEDRWAIHSTPSDWQGLFDVVTSFFALEHIPDPHESVIKIASLLTPEGVFYGIVPDTFGNVADFVVIDHVNHFTESSLHFLLRSAGFTDILIDSTVHRGALVFTARKLGPISNPPNVSGCLASSYKLANYWSSMDNLVLSAEAIHRDIPAAIYGSGFYGAYIASTLSELDRVSCFLDASPFQQGKSLFGREILPPHELPKAVRLLYVGLNPSIARATILNMEWLRDRNLELVFLDKDDSC